MPRVAFFSHADLHDRRPDEFGDRLVSLGQGLGRLLTFGRHLGRPPASAEAACDELSKAAVETISAAQATGFRFILGSSPRGRSRPGKKIIGTILASPGSWPQEPTTLLNPARVACPSISNRILWRRASRNPAGCWPRMRSDRRGYRKSPPQSSSLLRSENSEGWVFFSPDPRQHSRLDSQSNSISRSRARRQAARRSPSSATSRRLREGPKRKPPRGEQRERINRGRDRSRSEASTQRKQRSRIG